MIAVILTVSTTNGQMDLQTMRWTKSKTGRTISTSFLVFLLGVDLKYRYRLIQPVGLRFL